MATVLAKGLVFKVGSTQILGLTAVSVGGTTWKTEDTTSFDSSTAITTLQTTIRTEWKWTLTLDRINDNTEQNTLRTLSTTGASQSFVCIFPGASGETRTFDGYVTGWTPDVSVSGLNKVKVEITPAGDVTLS